MNEPRNEAFHEFVMMETIKLRDCLVTSTTFKGKTNSTHM